MALTKVSGDILDSGISVAGVVTATAFHGDGANLTGIANTATVVSTATTTGLLNVTGTTDSTSSTTGALKVTGGVGIGMSLHVGGNVSIGGTLTYQDVTNIDSVGLITARAGVNISGGEFKVGTAVTVGTAGVVTATKYYGDGSALTGITGTTINNNAANRIITGEGGTTLNGEANLTFDGDKCVVTQSAANIGFEVHSTGSGKGAQTMYHNDHGTTYVGVAGNTSGETHFYNASNTATRFYTNSAERIVIAADGKIGIGVAAPVAPLHIYAATNDNLLFGGNINASDGGAIRSMNSDASAWKAFELLSAEMRIGGTNSLRLSTGGTGGSVERLRITSDGKIGIGVAAPATKVHIHGGDETLLITGDTAVGSAANTGGLIALGGIYHTDGSITAWSQIKGLKDNNTSNNYAGYLSFTTRNQSAGYVERLRITSDGKLSTQGTTSLADPGGIHLATKDCALMIGATDAAGAITNSTTKTAHVRLPHYTNAEEPFSFITPVSASSYTHLGIGGGDSAGNSATDILFYTSANNTTTGGTERVRIAPDGDVGIGVAAPLSRLHVHATDSGSDYSRIYVTNNTTGSNSVNAGLMIWQNGNNTFLSNNSDGWMVLRTDETERVRITADGKVGINESSPDSLLHISSGSGQAQVRLQRTDAASNGNDYGRIYWESTDNVITGQISVSRDTAENNGYISLKTANGGTLREQFRIRRDGNLYVNSSNNNIVGQPSFYASNDSGCGSYRPHGSWPIHHFYSNAGGTYSLESYVNGNGSYSDLSDYRLKENIVSITNGIDIVKQLNPVKFDWKSDAKPKSDPGWIAHEVQQLIPTAVDGTKDQVKEDGSPFYQAIAQAKIVPYLAAALKEAIAKIETLEAKVAALESA